MLLCQNGGGHQIHHLLSLLYCLKCSPDGNFSLSVPYITADQAVHYFPAFHISLGFRNGIQLILCLLKGKHFLKLLLPYGIPAKAIAFSRLSGCIQLHKVFRHLIDGSPNLCLGFLPFL